MQVREADGLHRVRVPGAVQCVCVCACTWLAHQLARLIGRCACRHASVHGAFGCLWVKQMEQDMFCMYFRTSG